jgi:hypothetical protein
MWKSALEWTFARLSEPSSYTGVAGIVASMSFLPGAQSYAAEITTWGIDRRHASTARDAQSMIVAR